MGAALRSHCLVLQRCAPLDASGRDLLREVKPSTAKEVVLFANPDFNLGSTAMLAKADNRSADAGAVRGSEKRDIKDWSFGSLKGTQKERDELITKFVGWGWTPTDFTSKEATKEALLKIHSPYILIWPLMDFSLKKIRPPQRASRNHFSVTGRASLNRNFSRIQCTGVDWLWLVPKPRSKPGNETNALPAFFLSC
jgi:hypothetical protein